MTGKPRRHLHSIKDIRDNEGVFHQIHRPKNGKMWNSWKTSFSAVLKVGELDSVGDGTDAFLELGCLEHSATMTLSQPDHQSRGPCTDVCCHR